MNNLKQKQIIVTSCKMKIIQTIILSRISNLNVLIAYKSTRWETTSKYVIMHQSAFRVKNFQCSVTFNLESRVQIDDGQLNAVLNEKKIRNSFTKLQL